MREQRQRDVRASPTPGTLKHSSMRMRDPQAATPGATQAPICTCNDILQTQAAQAAAQALTSTNKHQPHLRLVKSADRLKQAKMAVDASAAVITMAGLIASARPTRGPIEVPWQKANVPSSA